MSTPAPARYNSLSIEAGTRLVCRPGGHIFDIAWVLLGVANFVERRVGEVRAEGRAAREREIVATLGMYGRLLLPHQLL